MTTDPSNTIVVPPEVPAGGVIDRAATLLGLSLSQLREELYKRPSVIPYANNAGTFSHYRVIPPHTSAGGHGVSQCDVLVVGERPNIEELDGMRMHGGTRGNMWKDLLDTWGVDYSNWLFVNACWWLPDLKATPASHFKEWQSFLAETINVAKPKYILCFGAKALKVLWGLYDSGGESKVAFKNVRGAVLDYAGGIKVMVATSPANVLADPGAASDFMQDMQAFCQLVRGGITTPSHSAYVIHEIDHLAQLDELVTKWIEAGYKRFAVDAEWGDGDWIDGKLRTLQIACSSTEAVVVILRRQGLVPAFEPNLYSAFSPLRRLFYREGVTVTGHNFRGDCKWCSSYGLDLMPQFVEGGFDTMLGHHLLHETLEQQLELCALRMLGMERYDLVLRKWLVDNNYGKDEKGEAGYGYVPDHILHPYAGMDAIATFALAEVLVPELKKWPGLWEHYVERVHRTNLPLLEMETTGIAVDVDRIKSLSELVKTRQAQLGLKLKEKFNWPDFNPRSSQQVADLLFDIGPYKDGQMVHVRPPDASCFYLTPIKATDKTKGLVWEKVITKPLEERVKHSPATDSETVAILAADCKPLEDFRRFKTVDQLAKNFLASEVEDEETGEYAYEKGLGRWIRPNGRIYTDFRQTLETGRYATRPNCFSADTEILTMRGWVLFPNLNTADLCAQYDTSTQSIDFVSPVGYTVQPFEGELLHIYTEDQLDLLCTPDHRCLIKKKKSHEWRFIPADNYPQWDQQFQAGHYIGGSVSYTSDQVIVIAALQADGHRTSYRALDWCFSNHRKAERLEKALTALNIPYRSGIRRVEGGKDVIRLFVHQNAVPLWLGDKRFFGDWLLHLDLPTFKLMSEEVWFWDGCFSRRSMFSSEHKSNADWVQILTVLSGRIAKIRQYNTIADTANWQVDACNRDYSGTDNHIKERVPYSGNVYCVEMPKGTVLVRRNNRVVITGNCQNLPKRTEPEIQKCFTTDEFVVQRESQHGLKEYWGDDGWTYDRGLARPHYTQQSAQDSAIELGVKGVSVVRLLDPRYSSIRSCFMASPGTVLVEPDWNQAELWTMGACAGDNDFLHVLATSDLHTEMMKRMFSSLVYKSKTINDYTVVELNKLRKNDKYLDALRTSAKTTNFGVPYGRGAGAIIREIKKEGVRDKTTQDAQGWIDTFFQTFPKVYEFLEWCKRQVTDPRYLSNPWGRYRRFPFTQDEMLIADYQREAVNFPIQSVVGDSMSVALINFWNYKRFFDTTVCYRLLLSIHDAVLLEVPYEHVEKVVEHVIPACMVHGVEVPKIGLKYSIGDIDIQQRWGEKADPDVLNSFGIPTHLCGYKTVKPVAA